MNIYDKGLITILGVAILFIVLAIPLVLRKMPRNVFYGFRTRATMGSDEVWFAANAHFGRGLIMASLFSAIVVIGIYLFRPLAPHYFFSSIRAYYGCTEPYCSIGNGTLH